MAIDTNKLFEKIKAMYPEIVKYNLGMSLSDGKKGERILTLTKDKHELKTHLSEQDVDNCLKGIQCVHLGVQLGRFVSNYCTGGSDCKV